MSYVGGEAAAPNGCVFCASIDSSDDRAALVVERTPNTVTLLNRYPYTSGHVMVLPIRHLTDPLDLDAAEGAALFAGMQRALRALDSTLHPDGYNSGFNFGDAAGGSVGHLHMHVVPRWSGDTNFMPVLGDVKVVPEHLEATAARLREAFSALGA